MFHGHIRELPREHVGEKVVELVLPTPFALALGDADPANTRVAGPRDPEPSGDGTLVRLEQSGFERVPDADRFMAGYDAGWKEVLGWFAERMTKGEAP